jgi:Fur family peroxide stress response transcriptional regulator
MSLGDRGCFTMEEIEQICRRHALPLTIQRRLILETLRARADHPTADQIFEAVRKRIPEISRTTVYRSMETLVRSGIARRVCHPGAAARYEMEMHRHHHLVCLGCEAIVDLQDPLLDGLPFPDRSSGFQIEDYSIQFRGLCSACAAKSVRRARTASSPVRKTKTPAKSRLRRE